MPLNVIKKKNLLEYQSELTTTQNMKNILLLKILFTFFFTSTVFPIMFGSDANVSI